MTAMFFYPTRNHVANGLVSFVLNWSQKVYIFCFPLIEPYRLFVNISGTHTCFLAQSFNILQVTANFEFLIFVWNTRMAHPRVLSSANLVIHL